MKGWIAIIIICISTLFGQTEKKSKEEEWLDSAKYYRYQNYHQSLLFLNKIILSSEDASFQTEAHFLSAEILLEHDQCDAARLSLNQIDPKKGGDRFKDISLGISECSKIAPNKLTTNEIAESEAAPVSSSQQKSIKKKQRNASPSRLKSIKKEYASKKIPPQEANQQIQEDEQEQLGSNISYESLQETYDYSSDDYKVRDDIILNAIEDIEEKEPEKAKEILIQNQKIASQRQDLLTQAQYSEKLAQIYLKEGNETALKSELKRLQELLNAYKDIKSSPNLKLLDQQQKIALLIKERDLQQLRIKEYESNQARISTQNKLRNTAIWGGIILVLVLLFIIFLLVKINKKRKQSQLIMSLRALRTQMNPHFIFNALNSINAYISENDVKKANSYLSKFAKLMRMVLEKSENESISLQEEFELIELYLKLEQERFVDHFEYNIQISPEIQLEQWQIPPLVIQPFLENAIWHGLRHLPFKGQLDVLVSIHANTLHIEIKDNGIGRERSKELIGNKTHQSTALRNLKERVRILKDSKRISLTFNITDNLPQGTIVNIELKNENIN